jgi:hypothetical protein
LTAATFSAKWSSTNGPFFRLRGIRITSVRRAYDGDE